jgi:hypothetical protein
MVCLAAVADSSTKSASGPARFSAKLDAAVVFVEENGNGQHSP